MFCEAMDAGLWGSCFPDKCHLYVGFRVQGRFDVELSSGFPSIPICIGRVSRHVPETVLSSVMSSDLCIVSLQDLLSSVCPLREVVTDSELTSGGRKELRTNTEKATLSLLEASMS